MKKIVPVLAFIFTVGFSPAFALDNANTVSSDYEIAHPTTFKKLYNVEDVKRMNTPHSVKNRAELHEKLNLTEEQKQSINEIKQKSKGKLDELYKQIEAKKDEIETIKLSKMAVRAQNEKIEPLREDIHKLNEKIRKIKAKDMKKIKSILTTEQKQELSKYKKERLQSKNCNCNCEFSNNKENQENKCNCNCGCSKEKKAPDFIGGYRPLPPKRMHK